MRHYFDFLSRSYYHDQRLAFYDIFDLPFKPIYIENRNFSLIDSNVISFLNQIESDIYCKKYIGDDRKKFNMYKHGIISKLYVSLTTFGQNSLRSRYSMNSHPIELQFFEFYAKTISIIDSFHFFGEMYRKEIEKIYKQKPIKTSEFPCFVQVTNNSSQEEKENQKDQNLLLSILDRSSKNNDNDNTQENQSHITFSQQDLLEFYDILCKPHKFFAFSPSFVFDTIERFDNFLNGLQKSSSKESTDNHPLYTYFHNLDSKSDEFRCYHLILLIKMRLFAMINQVYNFLAVLMELMIIEQEKTEMNIEDKFSYKKFLPQILPSCKTRRTKIIKKISGDQILDFCFSNDEQNDFILTKDGVFKIINKKDDQIEFEPSNLTKIDFDVPEFDEKMAKIAFSNGILYLFDGKTKTIHRVVVSEDEEYTKKELEIQKKLDNTKNHSEKNQTNSNKQTKAIKNENSKKKIREKEKKEKRQKRKAEKLKIEKLEFNNQTVKINLPDFQILSVGCYDNYFQIVQRKNSNEDKTSLILTIIDLEVNNRIGYNIEEAFQSAKENIKQTQIEVEIEHKQTKMKDVFFSNDYFMISFENSSIQQWIVYSDGRAELFKQNISPFANIANSRLKMDNKNILYN